MRTLRCYGFREHARGRALAELDGPLVTTTWGPAGQASALAGFEIDIEDFEGPLDLLVQLIEKQGLDHTGVSVLAVSDQFVSYAHHLPRAIC